MIRYDFSDDGGFYAIDDERHIACFAYPTSQHSIDARRDPVKVSQHMIDNFPAYCPTAMREEHYQRAIDAIGDDKYHDQCADDMFSEPMDY
jgi:hypothetical protein